MGDGQFYNFNGLVSIFSVFCIYIYKYILLYHIMYIIL